MIKNILCIQSNIILKILIIYKMVVFIFYETLL